MSGWEGFGLVITIPRQGSTDHNEGQTDPAYRRLAKRLLEVASAAPEPSGGVVQVRLTQEELASLVGISRESVNKHLRVWQDQGLISLGRGRLQILRPERLRALT